MHLHNSSTQHIYEIQYIQSFPENSRWFGAIELKIFILAWHQFSKNTKQNKLSIMFCNQYWLGLNWQVSTTSTLLIQYSTQAYVLPSFFSCWGEVRGGVRNLLGWAMVNVGTNQKFIGEFIITNRLLSVLLGVIK